MNSLVSVFEKRAYRTRFFSTKRFLKEERIEHIFTIAIMIGFGIYVIHIDI